jgi:tetratricopeptide (TPR) repeat protein|tara:strand:+ start:13012 stop:13755 length:744 start_codon:yes stop_codon:yes gene_type:complete
LNPSFKFFHIIFFFINILIAQDFSKIDKDLSELNFDKTLITLEELNNSHPNNEDILLRLSITHHYLSEQSIEKKEDKENAQKAYKYIVQAYNLNSEDPNILKWYVIALGKTVEEESIRRQIEQSKNIENLSLKVIEMMPDDEFCYNIMGQWHYKLASLGKASRRIASILFSEPPQGSFEQAMYFLGKSLELNADYIGTYYWLGKVHLKLGNKQKAYELFNKGILLDRPFKREEKLFQDMNKIIERNN